MSVPYEALNNYVNSAFGKSSCRALMRDLFGKRIHISGQKTKTESETILFEDHFEIENDRLRACALNYPKTMEEIFLEEYGEKQTRNICEVTVESDKTNIYLWRIKR